MKENKKITIFTIGDSTMANKNTAKENQERGWGQLLPMYFDDNVEIKNYAKDGRSSLSFINEGIWGKVISQVQPGDYLIIEFGHNDQKPAVDLHTDPETTFADNLRRFVKETLAKGGHPILMNSIVRRNFPPQTSAEQQRNYPVEGDTLVDTHGAYLVIPEKVAAELKVPFINMNRLTQDLVVGLGREESKKMFMWIPAGKYEFCPEGKIDNTHLNISGAKTVARIAAEALTKSIPELKVHYLSLK